MTNPIWRGHISFGLVNIPVTLYSADKRAELHFHMLDSRNRARVRYERINEETGKEVPWDKVVKAYEFEKNNYVILSKDDFERAAPKATKTIDIENFINLDEIAPVYFEKPYYLVPEKIGIKGYVLLRETLQKAKKVAIAKVVIREKQYLAALMPVKEALVLNLIRFKQELRSLNEFAIPDKHIKSYNIHPQELKMAEQLVNSMTKEWKPEQYHDEYREFLLKWIEKKSQHKIKKAPKSKEKRPATNVIDFMGALKQSLQRAQKTSVKNHAANDPRTAHKHKKRRAT